MVISLPRGPSVLIVGGRIYEGSGWGLGDRMSASRLGGKGNTCMGMGGGGVTVHAPCLMYVSYNTSKIILKNVEIHTCEL